jgi:hypothetical protein
MAVTGAMAFLLDIDLNTSSRPLVCAHKNSPEKLKGFPKKKMIISIWNTNKSSSISFNLVKVANSK